MFKRLNLRQCSIRCNPRRLGSVIVPRWTSFAFAVIQTMINFFIFLQIKSYHSTGNEHCYGFCIPVGTSPGQSFLGSWPPIFKMDWKCQLFFIVTTEQPGQWDKTKTIKLEWLLLANITIYSGVIFL